MKKSELMKGKLALATLPPARPLLKDKKTPSTEVKIDSQLEPTPLPQSIIDLHKKVDATGQSNDLRWQNQGWANLQAVKRRLAKEGLSGKKLEKKMLELYDQLFNFEAELPEGHSDEHAGIIKRLEGIPVVSCILRPELHSVGFGDRKKQLPKEVAAAWMQRVDRDGNFVYQNEKGEWRSEEGKTLFTAPGEGLTLKKTGVYTTSIVVVRDDKGKPTDINEQKSGLKIACPFHHQLIQARVRVPFLTYKEALQRYHRIVGDKMAYVQRDRMLNEDLEAEFSMEQVARVQRDSRKGGIGNRRVRKGGKR